MVKNSPGGRKIVAEAFSALMKGIYDLGEEAQRSPGSSSAVLDFQEILDSRLPRIRPDELERLLPTEGQLEGSSIERRGFLYLEPLRKGEPVLPVMTWQYDFNSDSSLLAFRILLFRLTEPEGIADTVGFRFETADSQGTLHRYNHMQMIRQLEKKKDLPTKIGRWKIRRLPWLPENQPAFPLAAESPLCLLLCLLVSLYGPGYLDELRRATTNQEAKRFVRQHQERMHRQLALDAFAC